MEFRFSPQDEAFRRDMRAALAEMLPDDIRERIVQLALDEPALSPRELAVRFTDGAVAGVVEI